MTKPKPEVLTWQLSITVDHANGRSGGSINLPAQLNRFAYPLLMAAKSDKALIDFLLIDLDGPLRGTNLDVGPVVEFLKKWSEVYGVKIPELEEHQ
jgi:hypothetical protein